MSFQVRTGAFRALRAKVLLREANLRRRAEEHAAECVAAGRVLVQRNLLAAHTRTGDLRQIAHGGLPGRFETGVMVTSVGDSAKDPDRTESRVIFAFGWFPYAFQEYFVQQDLGYQKIPAAHALPNAMTEVTQDFRRRMSGWARGADR